MSGSPGSCNYDNAVESSGSGCRSGIAFVMLPIHPLRFGWQSDIGIRQCFITGKMRSETGGSCGIVTERPLDNLVEEL